LTVCEQLVADQSAVPEYRADLALSQNFLGTLLWQLGRYLEAEVQYRRARTIREQFAADAPKVAVNHRNLGGTLNNLGGVTSDTGRRAEAVTLYEQAVRSQRRALELNPRDARAQLYLHNHYANLAMNLTLLGRRDEAIDHHRQCILVMQKKLAADFPSVPRYRAIQGDDYTEFGLLLWSLGLWKESAAQHRQALDLREKLMTQFPTTALYQRDVAGVTHNLGDVLARTGQRAQALALLERALHLERQALARDPQDVTAQAFLLEHHVALGLQLGPPAEAEAQLREGVTVGEKPLAFRPTDLECAASPPLSAAAWAVSGVSLVTRTKPKPNADRPWPSWTS
jgi:tetratricopeptide (TPR) repeat protein